MIKLLQKGLLCLFLLFTFCNAFSQSRFTFSGYVKDQNNGEELIGATLFISKMKFGVVSNPYGFFSITLPEGDYIVKISYLGFQTIEYPLSLSQNISKNFELISESKLTEEVVISSERLDENITDIGMSRVKMDIEQVKKLPALFGEVDIIKNVQMMPGVISAGEGTAAYFVRGGGADQNLILMDEAPIYDPSHLFGLFSVFNPDVVKSSELYKGGIPAKFGGRLSSILDVRTKDGNIKRFSVKGGIGLLASRVLIEGPIKKDKISFLLAGRRSYLDLFFPLIPNVNPNNRVYYYDFNGKLNFKLDNNNRVFISSYLGRDVFKFGEQFQFDWGNRTISIRWNHLFSKKLFLNTTLIGSIFDYGLELFDEIQGFRWDSNIQESSLKLDFSYFPNPKIGLEFGYQGSYRNILPAKLKPNAPNSIFKETELQRQRALDHAFYASVDHKISSKLKLQYGLRLSVFQTVGVYDDFIYEDPEDNISEPASNILDTIHYGQFETIKVFAFLEPRFSARYLLNEFHSIKFSYNRMVQNVHLVSNGTLPLPFNTWTISGTYLKPQVADQIALGYFRNFDQNQYEFSVEGYLKEIQNVTDYADNAELFFNEHLANEFRQGRVTSYGLEFFVIKKRGRITGSGSYTLSKTEQTIPDVNNGIAYRANYDRRHNLNLQAVFALNKRWTFGSTFTYTTGRPITLGTGYYPIAPNHIPPLVTGRNGYLLKPYHRLDISSTYTPKSNERHRWQHSLVFSIYNVYSRYNPFTVFIRPVQDSNGDIVPGAGLEAVQITLFGILPSVTYNFEF
jgi:CarboxypepD_reg-like domain/TonB-dependent Receptor Plug Domain